MPNVLPPPERGRIEVGVAGRSFGVRDGAGALRMAI
jgi:hypothetical protein